jgi:hypothetical protein
MGEDTESARRPGRRVFEEHIRDEIKIHSDLRVEIVWTLQAVLDRRP